MCFVGNPGTAAIAPQIRINETTNYWEVSTDNGVTWTSTGVKATGGSEQDLEAKEVTVTYNFNLGNIDLVDEIQNNNLFKIEGFEIEDLSYKNTELTFPGELIAGPGDTVTSILDKITKMLGEFEYFYNL